MPSYVAFLGHQPSLSLAELSAALPGFRLKKILTLPDAGSKKAVIFESDADVSAKTLGLLGGTVIIAKQTEKNDVTLDDVPGLLGQEVSALKGKITFSLRGIGVAPQKMHDLYRTCKNQLKKSGKPSRYVGNETKAAPSVLLHDSGIIDGSHGCEICIISQKDSLWIGKTVAAQDVDAYTERDMKKPVRDTTVGLLPPKLAQMLINFGVWLGAPSSGSSPVRGKGEFVVFDPFCGTGVIPMECLLRGFAVLASDKSQKAVSGCEKNLEWLRKRYEIGKKDVPSTVWKQDATKPFDLKRKPDAVVTETSLGPALTARPNVKDAMKMRTECEGVEADFLENIAASLPGVPVVITLPVWYPKNQQIVLEKIWKKIGDLGYLATLPPGVDPDLPGRLSLLYRRPDQFVGREIVMLRPRRNA